MESDTQYKMVTELNCLMVIDDGYSSYKKPDPDLAHMIFSVNRMPYFKNISVKKNRTLKYFKDQGLLCPDDYKEHENDFHLEDEEEFPI